MRLLEHFEGTRRCFAQRSAAVYWLRERILPRFRLLWQHMRMRVWRAGPKPGGPKDRVGEYNQRGQSDSDGPADRGADGHMVWETQPFEDETVVTPTSRVGSGPRCAGWQPSADLKAGPRW